MVASHQCSAGSGLNLLNCTTVFPALSSGSTTHCMQWILQLCLGSEALFIAGIPGLGLLKEGPSSSQEGTQGLCLCLWICPSAWRLRRVINYPQPFSGFNSDFCCTLQPSRCFRALVFLHLEKTIFPGLRSFSSLARPGQPLPYSAHQDHVLTSVKDEILQVFRDMIEENVGESPNDVYTH